VVDLSVVIVNYNAGAFLLRCLESIVRQAFSARWEVIVVDNASTDGSLDRARERYPFIQALAQADNLGFSRGVNAGFAVASGRYVLVLNPDTELAPDVFKQMVEFMDTHPGAGLAGGRVLNPDGTLQAACRRNIPTPASALAYFTGLALLLPRRFGGPEYKIRRLDPDTPATVEAISGSFMMVRRVALEDVGLLDEQFFMYGEDLDYCQRMGRAGWSVYYNPAAVLVHHLGVSTAANPGRAAREFYRAMWLFYRKHHAPHRHSLVNHAVHAGIVALRGAAQARHLARRWLRAV
jgi:GT2 family glycosyltransferase